MVPDTCSLRAGSALIVHLVSGLSPEAWKTRMYRHDEWVGVIL